MELIQYRDYAYDINMADKIITLEHTAWPSENAVFPSAPNTYVNSFVFIEADAAVCHVGIRRSRLFHRGQSYMAYGLSEVVTHPRYRNRGLASRAVHAAWNFILAQQADISIFTCAEERIGFYTRCGWRAMPGTCFVGGTREKPFRSDSLHLTTMMRFISPAGRAHEGDFFHTDIVFELGEHQLW